MSSKTAPTANSRPPSRQQASPKPWTRHVTCWSVSRRSMSSPARSGSTSSTTERPRTSRTRRHARATSHAASSAMPSTCGASSSSPTSARTTASTAGFAAQTPVSIATVSPRSGSSTAARAATSSALGPSSSRAERTRGLPTSTWCPSWHPSGIGSPTAR